MSPRDPDWMKHAMRILAEAEALDAQYLPGPVPPERPDAKFYIATKGEWMITVVQFSIEDQGFPPGSKGYDGAVRKGMTIVHMTRDVAERIFTKAQEQQS